MDERTFAISISLLLHGAVLSLVHVLGAGNATPPSPVIIDFTLTTIGIADNGRVVAPTKASYGGPSPSPKPIPSPREAQTVRLALKTPLPPRPFSGAPAPRPLVAEAAVAAPPFSSRPPELVAIGGSSRSNQATVMLKDGGTGKGTGIVGVTGKGTGNDRGSNSGNDQNNEHLRGTYRKEHFVYIKRIIEEHLAYPAQARRMQWEGSCKLSFVVLENGHVADIRVIKGTGHPILDENVIETIKRVSPFPRPPISVLLVIPFTYALN